MNIDEYVAFQKFLDKPPKELLIGNIQNVYPLSNDDEQDIPRSDHVSVALKSFLEGSSGPLYSRTLHFPECPDITFKQLGPSTSYGWYGWCNHLCLSAPANELLKIAERAPYGDIPSGKTKVDKGVRDCFQITNEQYGLHGKLSGIADRIAAKMYPGRSIALEFNKINIYKEGGHFSMHVDTPKPGVIGTFVVFGDGDFTGGDLVLQNDGITERYNSGMVAFYSNIPHCVEPVTSGCRVAATFYIMDNGMDACDDDEDEDEPSESPEPPREATPEPDLQATPLQVLQSSLPFGICLNETYSQGEVGYKGTDFELVERLRPHFQLRDVPIILAFEESYYDDSPEYNECTAEVYRFNNKDWDLYTKDQLSELSECDTVTHMPCYVYMEKYGREIRSSHQGYVEHVGNECQPGLINNIYLNRLLIVSPSPSPAPAL